MLTTIRNFLLGAFFLLAGLAVSLHGAETPGGDGARMRQVEERVQLARSLGEFVSELDLFDNHLYGRAVVEGRDNFRTESLRGQIVAKNVELQKMMNEGPGDAYREGSQNYLGMDVLKYYQGISSLESEIAGLLDRLNKLSSVQVPLTATELLDGSLWIGAPGREWLDPEGQELSGSLTGNAKSDGQPPENAEATSGGDRQE